MTSTATKKTRVAKGLTDQQRAYLLLGTRIRSLLCILAQARIADVSKEHRQILVGIVDKELHKLGYESYTEQRERIYAMQIQKGYSTNMTRKELDAFYKLKRLNR